MSVWLLGVGGEEGEDECWGRNGVVADGALGLDGSLSRGVRVKGRGEVWCDSSEGSGDGSSGGEVLMVVAGEQETSKGVVGSLSYRPRRRKDEKGLGIGRNAP